MAKNDIYNSEKRYNDFKNNLQTLLKLQPNSKYYCKNPQNLEHFRAFFQVLETKDISYARRYQLLSFLKFITHNTTKNLNELKRPDIDQIVIKANETYSTKTSSDFKKALKYIWRNIFSELDEQGRPDETSTPYVVRHISNKIDKSRQTTREDRFTWSEFESILHYFSHKPAIQYYLMQGFESLARPQELLWRKIKDVQVYDNYAVIEVSSHGKEGTKAIPCIDSYPYLVAWLNKHPYKNNPDAYLFLNDNQGQITPIVLNKHLRKACIKLGIKKPLTCYSFKRNGVTFRRLRGDKDSDIQKLAGWTSTKQLKTYDLSEQREIIDIELIKRGLKPATEEYKDLAPKTKPCIFCQHINPLTYENCDKCKRPLDRQKIADLEYQKERHILENVFKKPEVRDILKEFIAQELSKNKTKNKNASL